MNLIQSLFLLKPGSYNLVGVDVTFHASTFQKEPPMKPLSIAFQSHLYKLIVELGSALTLQSFGIPTEIHIYSDSLGSFLPKDLTLDIKTLAKWKFWAVCTSGPLAVCVFCVAKIGATLLLANTAFWPIGLGLRAVSCLHLTKIVGLCALGGILDDTRFGELRTQCGSLPWLISSCALSAMWGLGMKMAIS